MTKNSLASDEKSLSIEDLKTQLFLNTVVWKTFSADLASLKFPQCLEVFSQQEIILINSAERAVNTMLFNLQKAKEFVSTKEVYPPAIDLTRELLQELDNNTTKMMQYINEEKTKVFDRFNPSFMQFVFYPLATAKFMTLKIVRKLLK